MVGFKEFIKEKRIALGFSQNKFSKLIGITQSYFNSIERGEVKNPPSNDFLNKIAEGLKLTEEETQYMKYLAAFERTPDLIKLELEKKDKEINILRGNSSFNDGNFIPLDTQIPVYERISAGLGAIENSEITEYIAIPNIRNLGKVFAVNVWGDSMEPSIKDSSIIIAREGSEVRNGEIGAFILNNEAYVKRLQVGENYTALISDNPTYPPIFISPSDELNIVGRVIKVVNDL